MNPSAASKRGSFRRGKRRPLSSQGRKLLGTVSFRQIKGNAIGGESEGFSKVDEGDSGIAAEENHALALQRASI